VTEHPIGFFSSYKSMKGSLLPTIKALYIPGFTKENN